MELPSNINKSLSDGPVLSVMVNKQLVRICLGVGGGGGGGRALMGLLPRPHVDRQVRKKTHSSDSGGSIAQMRDFRHVLSHFNPSRQPTRLVAMMLDWLPAECCGITLWLPSHPHHQRFARNRRERTTRSHWGGECHNNFTESFLYADFFFRVHHLRI